LLNWHTKDHSSLSSTFLIFKIKCLFFKCKNLSHHHTNNAELYALFSCDRNSNQSIAHIQMASVCYSHWRTVTENFIEHSPPSDYRRHHMHFKNKSDQWKSSPNKNKSFSIQLTTLSGTLVNLEQNMSKLSFCKFWNSYICKLHFCNNKT